MKLQMSASQFAERIGKIDTIEHTASEKVGEAPVDGNEYVRKDGTWTKPDTYSKAEANETFLKKTETPTLDNVYTKVEVDEKFEAKGTSYTKEETYTKAEVEAKIPTLVDAYSKTESDERYPQKDSVYTKGDTYSKNEVDAKIPAPVDAYSKTESDERYPLKADTVKTLPESMLTLILKYLSGGSLNTMSDEDYNTILSYAPNEFNSYLTNMSNLGITKYDIEVSSNNIVIYCKFIVSTIDYVYVFNIDRQTKEVNGATIVGSTDVGDGSYSINQSVSDISGGQSSFQMTLLTNGTGSKFLSDNGSYKEIDTSSLAAKSEVSQYLNMPNELLSAIFNTTGDTATDENYATIVKYVPAGENKIFLGNMISLGLSGSGKFAITNNDEEITIIIDYQDSVSNQSTKSMIGINHSTKAVTFSRIINSISVKDSGLTIYGNKRNTDGTSLSKTIDLITNGTGSKYLSDDGSYKAIDINNLFFQPVSVTTLTNLPVDKYSIAATVSAASTISFASTPQNGMEYVIDIKNTSSSDITQPIPTDSNWQCDVDSVTLTAGKVTSISIRYVHSIYCVRV